MTKDELKETYSMRDILARYGLYPDRAGMIRCPFHKGDREPSLKVYDKDFHCFACGAHGDIFDFVRKMDGLSFKEAFLSLGGEYSNKTSIAAKMTLYRTQKAREQRAKERGREEQKRTLNNMLITVYRTYLETEEPLSDVWCDCYNAMQYQLYLHGILNGIPY